MEVLGSGLCEARDEVDDCPQADLLVRLRVLGLLCVACCRIDAPGGTPSEAEYAAPMLEPLVVGGRAAR